MAGFVIAAAVYVGIGYLVVVAVRWCTRTARGVARSRRAAERAQLYDGEAEPTLLDVAVARARMQRREQRRRLQGGRERRAA